MKGLTVERRLLTTCDLTESDIQLAIIMFTERKIGSLNDIVKHLFIKIVIQTVRSTMFHAFSTSGEVDSVIETTIRTRDA